MALNPNSIPGVTASTPAPGAASRASQIAYYAQVLSALPGTYSGNEKSYDGLTWPAFYEKLAAAQPSADPKALANTVLGIADTQGVAGNVGASAAAAINTGTSIAKGANAFTNQIPRNPFSSVLDFLNALGNQNLWIRAAKIILGGGLIVVGVAHLVGAEKIVKDITGSIPPVIPV